MNFETDTEFQAPRMSRVFPIEDDYYIFGLNQGGEEYEGDVYTVMNNGDHEVVVIGNLEAYRLVEREDSENTASYTAPGSLLKYVGSLDQEFNYQTLLPGESFTFTAEKGDISGRYITTLTMPNCCTVTDSSGMAYSASKYKVDFVKQKITED